MKSSESVTQSRKKLTNDDGSVCTTNPIYQEVKPRHSSILKPMTIILYIHTYTQYVWAQCSLPQTWITSEGLSRHVTSDHSLPTSSVPGQARTQKTCLAAWHFRLEKGNATQLHASTTIPSIFPLKPGAWHSDRGRRMQQSYVYPLLEAFANPAALPSWTAAFFACI